MSMADMDAQEESGEQEGVEEEGRGKGVPWMTISGLLWLGIAKVLGISMFLAFAGIAIAFLLSAKFLPPRARGFIMSFAVQSGHLLSMAIGRVFGLGIGGLLVLLPDIVLFGSALVWLVVKPGLGPILMLFVLQVAVSTLSAIQLSSSLDNPIAVRALIVHLLVRAIALILMAVETHGFFAERTPNKEAPPV